jgi:hypothetical protein
MATISGKNGRIKIGSTTLADITLWQLTTKAGNPAYASSATQGWKTRREGVRDASGTVRFKLDLADPITDDFDEGDAVTLLLHLDATRFYTVPAIIDSLAWEVDINDGDVIGGVAEFSSTGPITKPTYA